MTKRWREFLMTNLSDIRFDISGKDVRISRCWASLHFSSQSRISHPYLLLYSSLYGISEDRCTGRCPCEGSREIQLASTENFHFHLFFCRLLENVRVRRAGFAFRQEYDLALQRCEVSLFLSINCFNFVSEVSNTHAYLYRCFYFVFWSFVVLFRFMIKITILLMIYNG